jgi:hypothetical protein
VNNTNKMRSLRWLAGLGVAAVLAACGGGGGGGVAVDGSADALAASAARPGSSASCSFDHVFVTVDQLRLVQLVNGVEQWSTVALATPTRIDLVNLSGGLLQTLGVPLLAAGEFTQIQLILASGTDPLANAAQPTGGSLTPLAVPAGTPSGLKIQGDFVVPSGQSGDVVLQGFNPCQAIVQTGSPSAPSFQLKPNLTAQASTATVSASDGSPEFRVNTTTVDSQELPQAARLRDGGYVIAWTTHPDIGGGGGVFFQRYSANGTRVGGETRADIFNQFRSNTQVRVAALADGGFLLGWQVVEVSDSFTDRFRALQTARFSADGTRGFTSQDPGPDLFDIAGLNDGGYVRVLASPTAVTNLFHLSVQRYGADNAPIGGPVSVSDVPDLNLPSVTSMPDGGFLVTWQGAPGPSSFPRIIYTRRFGSDGLPTGAETQVAAGSGFAAPISAALPGGGYVVTWTIVPDDNSGDILAFQRLYRADGSPATGEMRIDDANDLLLACKSSPTPVSCPTISQVDPHVAALDDGGYVITFWTPNRPGSIYARRYNAQGAAISGVTEVAPPTPLLRISAVIAGIAADGFVIAWEAFNQDGDLGGIFAKQYGAAGLLGAAVP